MAPTTNYLVQTFNTGRGRQLRADVPIPCRSAEAARRTATKLAASKVGVVAFSVTGDAESGEWDEEPSVIFKAGRLPPSFGDE
jgi:hypothetical protein